MPKLSCAPFLKAHTRGEGGDLLLPSLSPHGSLLSCPLRLLLLDLRFSLEVIAPSLKRERPNSHPDPFLLQRLGFSAPLSNPFGEAEGTRPMFFITSLRVFFLILWCVPRVVECASSDSHIEFILAEKDACIPVTFPAVSVLPLHSDSVSF